MSLKTLFIVLFLALVFLPVTPAMADSPAVSSIAKQLVCPWNMVLADCTNPEHRGPMIALIEQKLAQGQSEEEIIRFFIAQYGEGVLASPPKRGFNLVAWLLPFVAILTGGGVIYLALKAWVRRGRRAPISVVAEERDEKYRQQLEEELKEFTERGFR